MIDQGLYPTFQIKRMDGQPFDPHEQYIVLRLDKDPAAAHAMMVYADLTCGKEPFFAEQIYHELGTHARRYQGARVEDLTTEPVEHTTVIWGHPDSIVICPECGRHGLSSPLRLDRGLPWRVVHRVAVVDGVTLPVEVCFRHAEKR